MSSDSAQQCKNCRPLRIEGRGTALGKRKDPRLPDRAIFDARLETAVCQRDLRTGDSRPPRLECPSRQPPPSVRPQRRRVASFAESVGQKLSDDDTTTVRPPEEIVIVSAHFDHLGIVGGRLHPGADDNASGVAMLLETARLLAARKLLSATVPASRGSRSWRSIWKSTRCGGRDGSPRILPAARTGATVHDRRHGRAGRWGTCRWRRFSSWERNMVRVFPSGSAPALGWRRGRPPAEVALLGTTSREPGRFRSVPGRGGAVPVLLVGRTSDYHTPRETADRVDFDKVAAVTRVFADVAWQIALDDERPVWREAEPLGHEEARTITGASRSCCWKGMKSRK